MTLAPSQQFGTDLCNALGFDPMKILSIDLSLHAGELAVVTVTRVLFTEDMKALEAVVEKYHMTVEPISTDERATMSLLEEGLVDVTSLSDEARRAARIAND